MLLVPVYFGSAVMFRVLQADLDSLQSMATLGIIHGVAEVLERSVMVVILFRLPSIENRSNCYINTM